eukprot:PhM_4_TR11034/c0_g2_i1/m.31461
MACPLPSSAYCLPPIQRDSLDADTFKRVTTKKLMPHFTQEPHETDSSRMIWLAYRSTMRAASTQPPMARRPAARGSAGTVRDGTMTSHSNNNNNSISRHGNQEVRHLRRTLARETHRVSTEDIQREAHDAALRLETLQAQQELELATFVQKKKDELAYIRAIRCKHTGKRMIGEPLH